MKQHPSTRRQVIKTAVAAAASLAILDHSQAIETGGILRVKLTEADGSPLASERLRHFHVRDMEGDPLPLEIYRSPGEAHFSLPGEPVQLVCRLKIPDFGEVNCYADNKGKGYTQGGTINFIADATDTRWQRVEAAAVMNHVDFSVHNNGPDYPQLAAGMWAGEKLALDMARRRISQFPQPRREVLFSGLSSPLTYYPNLIAPFKAIFNYGPTSWYTWNKEDGPFDQTIDYLRMDQSVNILLANNIAPKIFGYCYMTRGATPKWMQPDDTSSSTNEIDSGDDSHNRFNAHWPYERIKAEYQRVLRQTAQRYADRVHYVEVINEAHDKTNMWGLNHEQILEMTRLTCQAVREGSATIQRVINNCCLWAEYAVHSNRDGSRRWSPYRYLQDCLKAGAEFEIVGLQLYYPQYDLFEIDRMLDRFTKLGKPIQITEMSTASQDGVDTASMRPAAAPGWHGPWSEATQAEWAEGMYTLCYSKPQIKAIGWWDFADLPNHFWTFGGLLRADGTPKPAYHRIIQLQKQWGVGPAAGK
jgi:GH35 family endo-1,4-beta-xylanase